MMKPNILAANKNGPRICPVCMTHMLHEYWCILEAVLSLDLRYQVVAFCNESAS